jgi:hypothetical protein
MSTISWHQFGLTSEFARPFRTPIGLASVGVGLFSETTPEWDATARPQGVSQNQRILASDYATIH